VNALFDRFDQDKTGNMTLAELAVVMAQFNDEGMESKTSQSSAPSLPPPATASLKPALEVRVQDGTADVDGNASRLDMPSRRSSRRPSDHLHNHIAQAVDDAPNEA